MTLSAQDLLGPLLPLPSAKSLRGWGCLTSPAPPLRAHLNLFLLHYLLGDQIKCAFLPLNLDSLLKDFTKSCLPA